MKCALCKNGETQQGMTSIVLQRGTSTIIFKNVPAMICDNCGEYYLSEAMTSRLLKQAEEAVVRGIEVEILNYAT